MESRERIASLAAPGATQAGLVVDSVEIVTRGKSAVVTVIVDLPEDQIGSADIAAVASASRAISAALDEANVPAGPHTLEVATPGIGRTLTTRAHFLRARTRLVALERTDGTTVTGRLVEVDDAALTIEIDGQHSRVAWEDVSSGQVQVEFTRSEN